MKREELMVGDFVQSFPDTGKIDGIVCLREEHTAEEKWFAVVHLGGNKYERVNVGVLNPIPITNEILEKNGFHKINAMEAELDVEGEETVYTLETKEPYTFVEVEDTDQDSRWLYIRVKGEGGEKLIKYVHELQHAFKLFGVEKEIEL